jgi:rubrerythrin
MATELEPPAGLSVWERDLFDHLVSHMEHEDELVDQYEQLAATAGGHVAYLLQLVMEDERRHHRLFDEWVNALRASAEMRDVPPQIPYLAKTKQPDDVVATVRTFLAAERADAKDLGRLRKMVKDVREHTLWDVLLDVMELDTRKHIALLEFIERHPGR